MKSQPQVPVLGIDLGTTQCRACVYVGQEFKFIIPDRAFYTDARKIKFHSDSLPSAFCHKRSKDILLGNHALQELRAQEIHPDEVIRFVKRDMRWNGTKTFTSGGQQFTPAEISSHYLAALKLAAERQLGLVEGTITHAVVTVPAYFGSHERKATKKAALEMANFHRVELLDEPVAAALGLQLHQQAGERLVLVVDLGGGTFDVTLMRVGADVPGGFDELGRGGDPELGGIDWDEMVAELVVLPNKPDAPASFIDRSNRWLYEKCEEAKLEFCQDTSLERVAVRHWDRDAPKAEKKVEIKRSAFLERTRRLVECCVTICEDLLASIPRADIPARLLAKGKRKLDWECVDFIHLVGGGSRIPEVRQLLQERSGKKPHIPQRPQHAVVQGAALYGATLLNDTSVAINSEQLKLRSPYSIGVCYRHDATGELRLAPLIRRNERIPTVKTSQHSVLGSGTSLQIRFNEERVSKHKPGETTILPFTNLVVSGFPGGKSRPEEVITISLEYKRDGELSFSARFRGMDGTVTLEDC